MRFHLTKIIEDRSPVVVTKALEKCLKSEAWKIQRYDKQVVALGIGTSRSAVNLSDKATFEIDFCEGATTVQVEAEYQYTWFLSEESQNHTVHSRIESVFANMRAELDLAPDWLHAQSESEEPPAPILETTTSSEPSKPAIESVAPPTFDEEDREPTQQTPASQVESFSPAYPFAPESQKAPKYLLGSSDARQRLGFRTVSLLVVSIIVVPCVRVGISHFKVHPLSGNASKPVPAAQTATRNSFHLPDDHPRPLVSPSSRKDNLSRSLPRPGAPSEDLRRWLEQWAASERTRDAKGQASFYADDVSPYLTLDRASRDAVYRNKQDSIHNRKGLWTFRIEHVSIRRESPDEASVLLKKLVMTQTDSVRVSEHRISSFLTLKRTQDGWRITGERDLQHALPAHRSFRASRKADAQL
jgi:ketosteroid isomerase-like protein